jgi:hypothetical protein
MCCWFKGELVIQLIFLSKTIFCNLIKFPMTKKLLKIQIYLMHLKFKFFQITFIKSYNIHKTNCSLWCSFGVSNSKWMKSSMLP